LPAELYGCAKMRGELRAGRDAQQRSDAGAHRVAVRFGPRQLRAQTLNSYCALLREYLRNIAPTGGRLRRSKRSKGTNIWGPPLQRHDASSRHL
jgi:hypothetical protein